MTTIIHGISARCTLGWSLVALLGCPQSELAPLAPCTVSGVFDTIVAGGRDEVDLLFVVDNSRSMEEEQANLALRLPELVETLARGQFRDRNGMVTGEFTPVKSLHLAVVSSDMGTNGMQETVSIPGCPRAFGDDGLLISAVNTSDPACTQGGESYLSFTAGSDDPQALGASFGCITRLGTNGCGFEQQLEAMWKALAPSSETSFSRGTKGHGDLENAGFLRPNSVVAVIHVTDEEDCSIPDAARDLFNIDEQGGNRNISCALNPTRLHDVSRFVRGLESLRKENPDDVIFAAIAGIPLEAETMMTESGEQDFDAILSLKSMQFEPFNDPKDGIVPGAACTFGEARAAPARRFVEVAKAFGKNGIVRSICQDDFSSALSAIIEKVANRLEGACLGRKLVADPETKLAPCGLVEYLPSSKTSESDCQPSRGRRFLEKRKDESGADRIVCQLNQLAVDKGQAGCEAGQPQHESSPADCLAVNPNQPNDPTNPRITDAKVGWYYDDFSSELKGSPVCNAQRIAFTEGAEQERGSEVRFECLQPVFSVFADPKGVDAVNKPCEGDKELCQAAQTPEYPTLTCDPRRNTCQIVCQEDANCPDGWVCDDGGGANICLNPTCPPQ